MPCVGAALDEAARVEEGLGACYAEQPPRFVLPTDANCAARARAAPLPAASRWPPLLPPKRVLLSFVAPFARPVLNVVIKGGCHVHHSATLDEARACVLDSPHAGCRKEENTTLPAFYTGLHVATHDTVPVSTRLKGEKKRLLASKTYSLLDHGLCERCTAPATRQHPARVQVIRSDTLGQGELFNLSVAVHFRPAVRGPHLVYVRIEFRSRHEALLDYAQRVGEHDHSQSYRGPYLGWRVDGSPFAAVVEATEAVLPPADASARRCRLADLADT